jgi:hypothetical protein
MKSFVPVTGAAIALALSFLFAAPAAAGTTVAVSMTFAEPLAIVPGIENHCAVPPDEGLCGSGEVIPFGHAVETVEFGAACGGDCDLRTINLPGGSIISHEVFSNPSCPGVCGSRGRGQPASGTVADVIVGGTGIFAGASGNLNGSVHAAGVAGVAKLSGTIMLAN